MGIAADCADETDIRRLANETLERMGVVDILVNNAGAAWGARLCLMSAFESLHAALRIVASQSAAENPAASAWRDATAKAREASRLAEEAMLVFMGDAEL